VSKLGYTKQVTTLLFKFGSSAFVFKIFKFNYKYLENSKSISCRVRRKELGKLQVTLQIMAKLC